MAFLSRLVLQTACSLPRQGSASCPYVVLHSYSRSDQGVLMAQVNGNQCPVTQNQPLLGPTHSPVHETQPRESGWKEKGIGHAHRQKRRVGSSGRERVWSDAASRRPLISAPSNFRHLHSGPFHGLRSPPQHTQVRPLDRIAQVPDSHVQPAPPRLDLPPTPRIASQVDEERHRLLNGGNYSPMSFHVPRRQVTASLPSTGAPETTPPRIPPRAQERARPYTAPQVEAIKERVAGAMIEAERLQQQIDEIIERQSLYSNSRPSTPRSTLRAVSGKNRNLQDFGLLS